jgi:hypothetical protein
MTPLRYIGVALPMEPDVPKCSEAHGTGVIKATR